MESGDKRDRQDQLVTWAQTVRPVQEVKLDKQVNVDNQEKTDRMAHPDDKVIL